MPTKENDNGSKESRESDYDKDEDQLEEKQEEETVQTKFSDAGSSSHWTCNKPQAYSHSKL
jgi:hypothetical protein